MSNAVAVVKEKLNANVNYKITLEPEHTALTIEMLAETRDKIEKQGITLAETRDKSEKQGINLAETRDKTEKQGINPAETRDKSCRNKG